MASATGRLNSATTVSGVAAAIRACGSRLLTPTMSISTPVVVALAAMPAIARATNSTQAMMQRSRSTGLRIRRSSWSVTWIAPGCGGITARSSHPGRPAA